MFSVLVVGCTRLPVQAGSDGEWITLAPLNIARQETGAARIGDYVYVVGGLLAASPLQATDTVEVYDIAADAWSFVASLPEPRDHMAIAEVDGILYVIGGYAGDFIRRSEAWAYDPVLDEWFAKAPLPSARGACWAVAHGGRVYVFGGVGPGGIQRTTFIYDPIGDSWSMGADMPTIREHLTAAVVDDFIYVIGGRASGMSTNANHRYDPINNQWQVMTPMPTARSASATASFQGRIHVAGGEVPQLFAVHEVYDVSTNTWSTAEPMPIPRHGVAAATLDDRILLPGGGTIQGLDPTDAVDSYVPAIASVPAMSEWGVMIVALVLACVGCILAMTRGGRSVALGHIADHRSI